FAPAAVAASAPGFASVWVFLLTGLAVVPVAFAFAVLGRRFDEDGGPVVFARAAFGDLTSFVVGWVAYVSAFLRTSAVMAGVPAGAACLGAGLTVMFAYQGFEIGPVIAGQVRSSARSIPFATVGSLLLSILLYVGLVWACVAALPGLATEATPLAAAARLH